MESSTSISREQAYVRRIQCCRQFRSGSLSAYSRSRRRAVTLSGAAMLRKLQGRSMRMEPGLMEMHWPWNQAMMLSKGRGKVVAESEGFEPPIALRLCLISSQVHSTGLCQLSAFFYFISGPRLTDSAAADAGQRPPIYSEDNTGRRKQLSGRWGERLWQPANGLPSFSFGCASEPLRPASTPQE